MAHQWYDWTAINQKCPVLGRTHKANEMNWITITHLLLATALHLLAIVWMAKVIWNSR